MFFTMSREGGMAINLPAQLLNLISHICGTARPHKASDLPPNSLLLGKGGLEGGGVADSINPPPLVKLRVEMYTPVDFYKFKYAY